MNCPVCGEKTTVIDSAADCASVYRVRKCVKCKYKFTTTEQESDDLKLLRALRKGTRDDKDRKH